MRNNIEQVQIRDSVHAQKLKIGTTFQTLGATLTMDADIPPAVALDPGGAGRTVLLPPEEDGLMFFMTNSADAAEDLTVKEDSGTTTIAVVSQSETAIFWCGPGLAGALTWSGGVLKAT